jgi:hypothetical protein
MRFESPLARNFSRTFPIRGLLVYALREAEPEPRDQLGNVAHGRCLRGGEAGPLVDQGAPAPARKCPQGVAFTNSEQFGANCGEAVLGTTAGIVYAIPGVPLLDRISTRAVDKAAEVAAIANARAGHIVDSTLEATSPVCTWTCGLSSTGYFFY